jgi:hypothetical protein
MKSKISLCLFVLLSTIYNATAQPVNTALDYMKYISDVNDAISNDTWDYMSAMSHGKSARKIEKRRKDLLSTMQNAQNKIRKMPGFKGETNYRDSVLSYLSLSYIVFNEDYAKIIDMEEVAEQSYDAMEAYWLAQEKANEKLDKAYDMLAAEQKRFADKNEVTLVARKDKISLNLKIGNAVYSYYQNIYLIFFKAYKQEAYMLDALNKNDIGALEQNRNKLSQFAQDGIKKLDAIKPFNRDLALKTICRRMLDFYNTEALKKIPTLTNCKLKKDNYDKMQVIYDAKGEFLMSKEEANQYNKALKEYKACFNEYNRTDKELFDTRNRLIDNWNSASSMFLDRHVPK